MDESAIKLNCRLQSSAARVPDAPECANELLLWEQTLSAEAARLQAWKESLIAESRWLKAQREKLDQRELNTQAEKDRVAALSRPFHERMGKVSQRPTFKHQKSRSHVRPLHAIAPAPVQTSSSHSMFARRSHSTNTHVVRHNIELDGPNIAFRATSETNAAFPTMYRPEAIQGLTSIAGPPPLPPERFFDRRYAPGYSVESVECDMDPFFVCHDLPPNSSSLQYQSEPVVAYTKITGFEHWTEQTFRGAKR